MMNSGLFEGIRIKFAEFERDSWAPDPLDLSSNPMLRFGSVMAAWKLKPSLSWADTSHREIMGVRRTIANRLFLIALILGSFSERLVFGASIFLAPSPSTQQGNPKWVITHDDQDPQQTVRVNGRLAHAHRFIARFAAAQSRQNSITPDQSYQIETRFKRTPNLVTLVNRGVSSDQASSDDVITRYKNDAQALRESQEFLYVEPDYLISATATPNDKAFTEGTLWALQNLGQDGGTEGADIHAVPAWDISTGSRQVIVAVIDSGILADHFDLRDNLWQNPNEISGNGIDDDSNGFIDDIVGINAVNGSGNPNDESGHGTHIAGTIGALGNGGGPHVGVAWEVRIMALKFLGSNTGFTSDAITCIEYAIAQGANIINASWGSFSFSTALRDTIANANAAGILFVAAAGNDAVDTDVFPHYPSNYDLPNIISVAALDRNDALASFSNFGATTVDLGAPGVSIFSTGIADTGSYAYRSGTSMASPHVTGVAALVKSHIPNISLEDLKGRILAGTTPVGAMAGRSVTSGRVNAHGALTATGDGILELQVGASEIPFVAGRSVSVFVNVSDTFRITDATVTAELIVSSPDAVNATAPTALLDDGVAPDPTPGDGQYVGTLDVPLGLTEVTLRVQASAPGKAPSQFNSNVAVIAPPANDNFADRILLSASTTSTTGTNVAASRESSEPLNPPTPNATGGSTVWWTWPAGSSGPVTVNTTGSSFDTTLAVYRGTALRQLELIDSNDDYQGTSTSQVTFVAIAGVHYHFQVDGFNGSEGTISLQYPEPTPAQGHARIASPPSSIQAIQGGPATLDVESFGADPRQYQWYKDGNPLAGANGRALNFPTLNLTDAGLYSVEVINALGTEFSQSTPLAVTPQGSPPINDQFADATTLTGRRGSIISYNTNATGEAQEPDHATNSSPLRSVWFQWQAPESGALRLRTFGSDFDTTLAVYQGTAIDQLTLLRANNNAQESTLFLQSDLSLLVEAGMTYQIAVAGAQGASGNIRLDWILTTFAPGLTTNGSFETGDLAGWNLTDFLVPQAGAAAGLATTLVHPALSSSIVAPSDGHFAFVHGFEALLPSILELNQTTTLPVANLSLVFDYRAGWEFNGASPPTLPRNFVVTVEPLDGSPPLVSQTVMSTGLNSLADTGLQRALIPLNNVPNQAVRIRLTWEVPESLKGPGFFELDHVRLIEGCDSIVGLTYSVASSPADLNQGDHFHSTPSIDSPGVAEVGRLLTEEIRGITELDLRNVDLASSASLKFQTLTAGGQFSGINDSPFQGSIILETVQPATHQSPDLSAYHDTTIHTLGSFQTSEMSESSLHEINVTTAINDAIRMGRTSLGIRFRADPIPPENAGAWTFGNVVLLIDSRVQFGDANLEQIIRSDLGIPSGTIKSGMLKALTQLAAPNADIASLQGLEFAINLNSADLSGNLLTDLSALTNLTALQDGTSVGLRVENNFLDIAPGSNQRNIIFTLNQRSGLTVIFRPQRIIDTDADGLDDRFEQRIIDAQLGDLISSLAEVQPQEDFDGDQRTNREEFHRFSDPTDDTSFGRAGDIDGDQSVTLLDLILLNSHLKASGTPLTPDQTPFADIDLDGTIDQNDRASVINSILND